MAIRYGIQLLIFFFVSKCYFFSIRSLPKLFLGPLLQKFHVLIAPSLLGY